MHSECIPRSGEEIGVDVTYIGLVPDMAVAQKAKATAATYAVGLDRIGLCQK